MKLEKRAEAESHVESTTRRTHEEAKSWSLRVVTLPLWELNQLPIPPQPAIAKAGSCRRTS